MKAAPNRATKFLAQDLQLMLEYVQVMLQLISFRVRHSP